MSVKIVVDSTVDLVPELKAQVKTVALSVLFGEQEYKDGVTINPVKFYEMLTSSEMLPTTSQPTPVDFEDAYRELVEAGHEVVCITISSRLSGTYQSATIAANEFPGKVFVVDSRNAAIGAGLLVEWALKLVEAGKSGQEILEALMEKRKEVRLYAMVDTLEYLKKGGRLSASVAFVGGVLNLKPIICLEEGEIKVVGKARGMKAAFTALTKACQDNGVKTEEPFMLGYTGCSDENLAKYMAENTDLWPVDSKKVIVGATIGTHAGPGAVAMAFFAK